MKLYLVRIIENQEAVGLFWSSGGDELWWAVDQVTAPGDCEWAAVKGGIGVIWPDGGAGRIGVDRDDVKGFSMGGAEADEALSEHVEGFRPLTWTAFNGVPPEFREAVGASA
jgi:hypothetical protein